MSGGITTTFELLATTANEAATKVLIAALDSRRQVICEQAVRAILARRSPAGQRELLRRLHTLAGPARAVIESQPGCLACALRDAVLGNNLQTFVNACQEIVRAADFDLIPALVTALEDESHPSPDLAARTLLELADMLHALLSQPQGAVELHHRQIIRARVVETLEHSVNRFNRHRRRQVVEAFLRLATRDSAALQGILGDPHHGSYLVVSDVLSRSTHEGVMRLLLSFVDYPLPPSAALTIMGRRADPRFVSLLLSRIAEDESATVLQNLKRIEAIAWARGDLSVVDSLDDAAQQAAVKLTMASRMNRTQAFRVIAHLLRHGQTGCRRAAVTALAEFSGAAANTLVLEALHDRDPEIQARAVPQLRHRAIPGALHRLIDLLDSPHASVRRAARQSLEEFTIERYLAAYETLDGEVRRTTGYLVKKVDPQTVPRILAELRSPVRGRRLRAIHLATLVDLVDAVEPALLEILVAGDHIERVEAVRALAQSSSPAARAAVEAARLDSSTSVQQATEEAILEMHQFRAEADAGATPAGRRETDDGDD